MPFDSAPSTTTADPFTVESLAAWLETQDAATEYQACQPFSCLIAQYTKAMGGRISELSSEYRIGVAYLPLASMENVLPIMRAAINGAWTYGAALERCRAILREPSGDP